jgi:hypothetical protein
MGCYFILRELDQALASVLLLGGEISGETNGIEDRILALNEPITLMTIAFLEAITLQRQQILRGHSAVWPPRVSVMKRVLDDYHRRDLKELVTKLVGNNNTTLEVLCWRLFSLYLIQLILIRI